VEFLLISWATPCSRLAVSGSSRRLPWPYRGGECHEWGGPNTQGDQMSTGAFGANCLVNHIGSFPAILINVRSPATRLLEADPRAVGSP
jgi:hypothetical protein